MKTIAKIAGPCFFLSLLTSLALGQATPAVNQSASYQGFQLPTTLGDLTYSVNANQFVSSNYNGSSSTQTATSLGGDLGLLTNSETHPFSMVYSGGYTISEPTRPSNLYQSLALSQVLRTRLLTFVVSDGVSYLPETPTTGLSGVAGTGDVGLTPINPGNGVLTNQASRISNSSSASVSGQLNAPTSLSLSGSYAFTSFLGSAANEQVQNSSAGFSASVGRRLNALSSLSLSYNYSLFLYPATGQSLGSQGLMVGWSKSWSRKITTSLSAGPQRVGAVGASPAAYDISVSASANYAGENASSGVSYSRGVSSGDGLSQGATNDSIGFNGSRKLGPVWNASSGAGFTRSVGLSTFTVDPPAYRSVFASGQLSRGLIHNLSLSMGYTFQYQLPQGNASSLAFNGHSQTFNIGVSYSPMAIHLGGH